MPVFETIIIDFILELAFKVEPPIIFKVIFVSPFKEKFKLVMGLFIEVLSHIEFGQPLSPFSFAAKVIPVLVTDPHPFFGFFLNPIGDCLAAIYSVIAIDTTLINSAS